jgi:hypothetical protein
MYMFCMKYVEIQAHEVYEMYNNFFFAMLINGILVCNNTHGKLCIRRLRFTLLPTVKYK